MANSVELKLVIKRPPGNTKQHEIHFFREGHGDDMVEDAADDFETVILEAVKGRLQNHGGEWIKKVEEPGG